MNEMENRRVRPGDPAVSVPPGRITVVARHAGGGQAPDLEVRRAEPAVHARPLGPGRWSLELPPAGSGELGARWADGDVFPTGSVLDLSVELPGVRLNVLPRPDVSGLRAVPLLSWVPGVAAHDGTPRVRVRIEAGVDLTPPGPVPPTPGLVPVVPPADVERLGPVAVRARTMARELVGAARLRIERQRTVVAVLDTSTSMRALTHGRRPADVLAIVLGAAEVIGSDQPAVHLAHGPWVRRVDTPDKDIAAWLPEVHEPDAFGFTLAAVRQALPPADRPRDVVVITDDVPPDAGTAAAAPGETWRVIALDAEARPAGAAGGGGAGGGGHPQVVPAPARYWAGGELDRVHLRELVAAVVGIDGEDVR